MKLRLDATYSHLARLPKNDSQVLVIMNCSYCNKEIQNSPKVFPSRSDNSTNGG